MTDAQPPVQELSSEEVQAIDQPVLWRLRQWAFLCALDAQRIDPEVRPLLFAAQLANWIVEGGGVS